MLSNWLPVRWAFFCPSKNLLRFAIYSDNLTPQIVLVSCRLHSLVNDGVPPGGWSRGRRRVLTVPVGLSLSPAMVMQQAFHDTVANWPAGQCQQGRATSS